MKTKYCAVYLKTESGDDSVFCISYTKIEQVMEQLLDYMGEEMEYVSHYGVDSLESPGEEEWIDQTICEYLDNLEK